MRPVRVLTVCTGNICRSPAIERLLVLALANDDTIQVASAGTGAVVGHPISEPMAALIASVGARADGFAARQLTADQIAGADLVLTATKEHRSRVVALVPGAVRRTFTLLELARLAAQVEPGTLVGSTRGALLREMIAAAPMLRARAGHGEDDIADPWHQPAAVYQRSFDLILTATSDLARVLLS